jgi:polysaccharide pyruvyl transferase WcaK-like protein
MGGDGSAIVTADPVFAMEPCRDDMVDNTISMAGVSMDEKFFVLSVREWKTMDPDAVDKICQFSKEVYNRYGIKALVIPMQKTRDKAISTRIYDGLNLSEAVYVEGLPPRIMMSIIEKAQFVVGMRLHTLIYAAKSGVPSIALDYDPKVDAVMKYVGIDFTEKVERIDADVLIKYVDEILERYDEITDGIKKKSEELSVLARKNTEMAIELLNRG